MKVLDLFSGIGGFSLGLERAGMETVAFCEIDPYCQKILAKHWPKVPIYDDIRQLTKERLESDGITGIDVITGGFPCQDISIAGKQVGITGERSGLWSELARIISEVCPRYAILENVTALISGDRGRWFGRVLGDLAEIGYDCEWHCISASAIGAHHHRDRVWIICYPNKHGEPISPVNDEAPWMREHGTDTTSDKPRRETKGGVSPIARQMGERVEQGRDKMADTDSINVERSSHFRGAGIIRSRMVEQSARRNTDSGGVWFTEPDVGRVANGIPRRVDRLKGLGNAVVPQIPELIGKAILNVEMD